LLLYSTESLPIYILRVILTSYINILIYIFSIVTYSFLYPIVYNLSHAHNVHTFVLVTFIWGRRSTTIKTANFFPSMISCATLWVTFSAKGAAMRKSKSSLSSARTLKIGFFGTRHRWTILVARCVSFSAMTQMLCAVLIKSDSRCSNSTNRTGSSNRWNCSPLGIRERGSASSPYGPGPRYCPALYRV
jgi:hypothetical protein